jgi:hypothetical protein
VTVTEPTDPAAPEPALRNFLAILPNGETPFVAAADRAAVAALCLASFGAAPIRVMTHDQLRTIAEHLRETPPVKFADDLAELAARRKAGPTGLAGAAAPGTL